MRIHNVDDSIAEEKNQSRGLISLLFAWLEGFFFCLNVLVRVSIQ